MRNSKLPRMKHDTHPSRRIQFSRREFLVISAASAAAVATGCATNPVTGRRQLMFISEAEELNIDKQWAPHQFSSDYGAVQDPALNDYLSKMGMRMAGLGHRPNMPYNFRVLNMVNVNGYTFPAGSVGISRGLLVSMENEAELAAVVGHELGHVASRHTGKRMTQGMITGLLVAGVTAYVATEKEKYAWVAAGLGAIGSAMLLSRYSREDEREADHLGLLYMTQAGYNPRGMAGLMETFVKLQKRKPGIVDVLFATHPMSDERYATAMKAVNGEFASSASLPDYRDRYMDTTASLRKIKDAIELMQDGEQLLAQDKAVPAEAKLQAALKRVPNDYTGLLLMSKCCLAQKKNDEARRYAEQAKAVYPVEPQALHLCGMAKLAGGQYDAALSEFTAYGEKLPGNPNTIYYRGFCHDKMNHKRPAGDEYEKYLSAAPDGEFAEYAQKRLIEWGYRQPPAAPAQPETKK